MDGQDLAHSRRGGCPRGKRRSNVIAAEHFGLTLRSMSKAGHDAFDADGKEVQIKLTAGNSVSMFADCERLIVLPYFPQVEETIWSEFSGPFHELKACSGTRPAVGVPGAANA